MPLGLCLGISAALAVGAMPVRAVRTATAPEIDGALGDPQWAAAIPFDDFVQSFPSEGAPPSERTEVRVLYDDQNLYVGVTAFDTRPEEIAGTLGRRDAPPASDLVTVTLDPTLDRRTGYAFTVNAGGVIRDGIYTDDVQFSAE